MNVALYFFHPIAELMPFSRKKQQQVVLELENKLMLPPSSGNATNCTPENVHVHLIALFRCKFSIKKSVELIWNDSKTHTNQKETKFIYCITLAGFPGP